MNTKPIIVLTFALALLAGSSSISAWTAPNSNPPSDNVAAPLTTGPGSQLKDGGLGLRSLAVTGTSRLNSIWAGEICDIDGQNCMTQQQIYDVVNPDTSGGGGTGGGVLPGAPVYFGQAGEVSIGSYGSIGVNTWRNVSYPARIPDTASSVLLGIHLVTEDSTEIYAHARSSVMPNTRIARLRAHNSTSNDSAGSYQIVPIPYTSDRRFQVRFERAGSDDAMGRSYMNIVGYVQGGSVINL